MEQGEKRLLERIFLCRKHVNETFMALPESEQNAWRHFFQGYARNVIELQPGEADKVAPGLAQLWVLSQEYYRLYGPTWK